MKETSKQAIEKLLQGVEQQLRLSTDKELQHRLPHYIRDIRNELEFLTQA